MEKIGEFWVPDVDAAPGENRDKSERGFRDGGGPQIAHLDRALSFVPGRVVAVDGGANIGAWTRVMAQNFGQVHSFEPNRSAFECLARNVSDWGLADKVSLHDKALSDRPARIAIGTREGARTVTGRIVGPGDIEAVTIDSLGLEELSFLKLDLEGHEAQALRGALTTIKRFQPWILIENKPRFLERLGGSAAEKILRHHGYQLVEKIGAKKIDWLYRPPAGKGR